MPDEPWLMRVEGALDAHFKQPDGPSRPGTDWVIGLKRGDELHQVRVRSYLSADATAATRGDTTYLGRTVMQYLDDLLRSGWHPSHQREHVITIGNPLPGTAPAAHKPWWRPDRVNCVPSARWNVQAILEVSTAVSPWTSRYWVVMPPSRTEIFESRSTQSGSSSAHPFTMVPEGERKTASSVKR